MTEMVKGFGCRQAYENLHLIGRSDAIRECLKADSRLVECDVSTGDRKCRLSGPLAVLPFFADLDGPRQFSAPLRRSERSEKWVSGFQLLF